ncbi:hypothetical protein BGI30_02955 [Snodgrassella alvi]|jgi:hypothetical protein|uniref:hypothetical protein n=1 Tax=Snodgrassella alvi TaxID=1196083 RepID=UPI000C1F816B|nr:hypothetical protein [Snodgrassella alvi]PIT12220.1 hypothetical protein BGI30_02955 [Snodgrassella alvi]PIT57167.1 hypothetical protein BHC59_04455 [Snodgrassella alvi]
MTTKTTQIYLQDGQSEVDFKFNDEWCQLKELIRAGRTDEAHQLLDVLNEIYRNRPTEVVEALEEEMGLR